MDVAAERKNRIDRLKPHLPLLSEFKEPRASNKGGLMQIMKDLKDEGNTQFKEAHFKEAGLFYSYALIVARQLERTFYHTVEREFLAVLYCNASLCSLKIDDYKEALKDAEAALTFEPENIKAMYRRASALEGLGRLDEALKQAIKGQNVDKKNNFDDLVAGLRAKVSAEAQQSRSDKLKDTKGKTKSNSGKTSADAVGGKDSADKKKEQAKDMNPKKKKKGQSQQQQQQKQQQASKKKQPAPKAKTPQEDDSDSDSDSTDSNNDSQFAQRMASIQGAASVMPQRVVGKPAAAAAASASATSVHTNSSSGRTTPAGAAAPASASKGGSGGTMGLDNFNMGKPASSKDVKASRPAAKPTIFWPMEHLHFRLVCRLCFVKEREGIGGYIYRPNYSHSCLHDILIVHIKSNQSLSWLKIRPRFTTSGMPHTFQYKLCLQFQKGMPCRLGEANCTFAHSPLEINFWNMDRENSFNIARFIKETKDKGVYSSDMAELTSSAEPPGERYIPGMATTNGRAGASSVSPPSAQPPPFNQPAHTSPPVRPSFQENRIPSAPPPSFSMPPPSGPAPSPASRPSSYPTQPPTMNHPPPASVIGQPQMGSPPAPNHQPQSNPGNSAPTVANPFPNFECRVVCPTCLQYTGRPWFYHYNPSIPHQCQQSILAYKIRDDLDRVVWVQIRERASHRYFKGNYVICYSVTTANPDMCKFKESCTFAHNQLEQAIWKLEQEGRYDIREYMNRNKLFASAGGTTFSPNAQSSSGMYVRALLDKHGGYFRFICRDCFFAPRPMISGMHSNGVICLGQGQHNWQTARIIAHVKDTAYTPVDERKFHHEGAFYLLCNYQIFCSKWFSNRCQFAHSQVEKEVWMLERDTKITRDELVHQSASLFTAKQTMSAPPHAQPGGGQAPKAHMPQSSAPSWPGQGQGQAPAQAQAKAKPSANVPSVTVTEYCRTCWGKGQRSEEDKGKDKCVRGHSNFKLNSAFVALPTVKEIRSLPSVLSVGMKLILCEYHPKCTRRVCNHPHGQEELEVWSWMLRNDVKTLREVCDLCKEAQKQKTRKIDKGETVISVTTAPQLQVKSLNQIIAPGDLHIHEHYCQYCGVSSNSDRQWDEHCMTERHINNVNSDKEHQWNFRQPPWGQGGNLDLCAKHLHNKSCQYSYVPDMYNMCNHAHSQEELDEWRERFEWRQMKRNVARDRNMFSYTESLLHEYHSQGDSVNVICDSIPGIVITCNESEVLYRIEKNDIFTWTYEIRSQKSLEKVALLHNKDRLHFKLLSSSGGHHQMASGDLFLDVDSRGKPCYKVTVHFNGGIFGSFSQWVVFDFGSRPVLRKKLSVEIGDQLQHDRVKELREQLDFDRWTSQNREIVRMGSELIPDHFTEQLLNKYKEPSGSADVVTSHRLTDLNQHNYIHKMHGLLELEEITRHAIISSYNLSSDVTFSKTLQEPGMFLIGTNGDLFIKVNLTENLTQDTLAGKLVLSSVRTALLARAGGHSRKVYEVSLVGESNYGYDGRGKEYVYLVINAETTRALGVSQGQTVRMELQFQMDRRFFCRMHHALDSMRGTDVVFPDVVKFKPDINELNALTKIRSSVLNEDQMIAVRHIVVQREGYTPPFIMYGPFGTGKTETLAQATMTLLRERRESCRILICTQSNSAADLYITKHLHAFVTKGGGKNLRILRLNAEERRLNTVPDKVLGFSHCPNKGVFEIPSKEEVASYHLVLTTVENSLVLSSLGLHGCFTHIFVDEAGQTLECEILMPLSLATTKTCVVLTGDHHQIGPMVYSQEARRQNFGVSILVRLFNYYDSVANCGINLVSDRCQKSPLNIFLSINYRTKTEILRFISSVFYGGPDSLKAFGKIPSVMGITPLMFYAVQGRESQNTDSTSYLNHAEAQEVVARVTELLDNWPDEWGPKDPRQVAVISTYSDQVKHVRKMLRQDKRQPLLSQVDVGPIHSFQGKEVRALFITAVRTSNLLREPHIIRCLESNEDIGDLGFMSDAKLLNTALTRTQSFVAVVGDPAALCLIGECTQIWRTYLKHCSNMGSVRPMSYTYEAIKNMVSQIHLGPEGQVIEMIMKRGQESFKNMLNIRKSAKQVEERFAEVATNGGDAVFVDRDVLDLPAFTSVPQPSGEDQSGWRRTEQISGLRRSNHHSDELVANSATISDDILFQLARECQGGAASSGQIWPDGISVTQEKDGLVVLNYSSGVQMQEPFKVVTEDNDFVAFSVQDEDSGQEEVYENWSKDSLWSVLSAQPDKFFKCLLSAKSRVLAEATVIDPASSSHMIGKQIEIHGSLNRGHALDGDTVVVEVTEPLEDALLGRVKGILERAQEPSSRLSVCTGDSENPGVLTPVNAAVPRFYTVTSAPHVALARKGYVSVYRYDSKKCVEFSSYERVDAANPDGKLFIVRYLFWQPGLLLPCGVVVGVIRQNRSLEQGMKVIDVEHNVQRDLSAQTVKEAESLFPADSMVPTELLENRQDLTQTFCFSIGDSLTQDVELVISVTQTGNMYELGVHVADVAAYVDKDSVIDQECELRGASLFPLGQDPLHMLPPQAATDVCSLRPGLDRLAISVLTRVDGEGKPCGAPEIFRSIINSKRHFSHAEVEEILMAQEETAGDYLKSCIIVLYQLAFLWRQERLGNAHFFSGLEPEKKLSQHSHLILNEVKLHFDSIIAGVLLTSFPETTPLLIQPPPEAEKLERWKQENAVFAIYSIPMTKAFLKDKVCRCTTACTCVFSYIRQHRLEQVKHLAMLKESWLIICQAVSEEYQDFELAQELITSPEHLPQVWLSGQRLVEIQQDEAHSCSAHLRDPQDMAHYGLCLQRCTRFTSPMRSFISLVVHRMLAAHIDGAPSPYNSAEMSDLCGAVTLSEREAATFHKDVHLLHLSAAILARPLVVTAVVDSVNTQTLKLHLGLAFSSLPCQEIELSLLSPAAVSSSRPGSVQLDWLERIYQYPDCNSPVQYSSSIKLDADRLVCNIPFIPWQKLLIAVREKDDDKLQACVKELSHHLGGELDQHSSQPQVLSDQLHPTVPFSLGLSEGQSVSVQLSSRLQNGQLQPYVQLLQLTPSLSISLEHRIAPEQCFTYPGPSSPAQVTYNSELKYVSDWLLPALAPESARQAVEFGDRVTIHGVSITWSTDHPVAPGEATTLTGTFLLTGEFCERSSFWPNSGSDLASALLDGKPLYSEDPNYSLDFVCVRYFGINAPEDPSLAESVAAVVNSSQQITWVAHCRVTEVMRSARGFQVKVVLIHSSMTIPEELTQNTGSALPCTLEWICKTDEHRTLDIAARGLLSSPTFVKDIITGKKPLNTLEPVPVDSSLMRSPLQSDQEQVVADCYRQPFMAVIGGPGTSKSVLAARLAHLLMARNRTTDSFRQAHLTGPSNQLMICAPTERSLDVITGYLQHLNVRNVRMVRVYSQEVEERDFPLSFTSRQRMESLASCVVMKDFALHHRIRQGESPEVKELLEQELLLAMSGSQMASEVKACMKRAQMRELRHADVILCTALTSARPVLREATSIRQIIMDDAGLIPEIEAIVPLVMHRNINQLVMFGDPQMPQRAMSSELASRLGLSRPLLLRYQQSATILKTEYRTTEALARFPFSHFYGEELVAASTSKVQAPAKTIPWPGQSGVSCVFCHIQGEESRVEASLGTLAVSGCDALINLPEIQAVIGLVRSLLGYHRVAESSILILTVTQSQAAMIRKGVPPSIQVSTVLESIGRECSYVILSTVRSVQPAALEHPVSAKWVKEHVGSLADAGLVNLAITRAKSALFILGNKDVLGCCDSWQSLLASFRQHQCLLTDSARFLDSLKTY